MNENIHGKYTSVFTHLSRHFLLQYPVDTTFFLTSFLKFKGNVGGWWHSGKDCPPVSSGGRACPPSLFDCHGPWHWDLALAWVLEALAAQEFCQKFKFWSVLCYSPLTPCRPPRCVSALRVRDGQVLPTVAGAERCDACAVAVITAWWTKLWRTYGDFKDLDKLGIDLETSLAAIRTTHDALLHSALKRCACGLECTQHSVHSKV